MHSIFRHIFRHTLRTFLFSGFLLLAAVLNGVSASTLIERADSAYNAQKFREALSLYNQALQNEGSSPELYYNIGNAYYRTGNIGKALVFYERALKLDPSNADAKANVAFVNSQLKGLPEDGSSFLSNVHDKIVSYAAPNTWAITAMVLFITVLGFVALYLFASGTTARKIGFFGGILVFVAFAYTFIIAWQTARAYEQHDTGIVITTNARLTSNPGTSKNKDEKAIAIPEGSKVEIVDSLSTPNDPVTVLWYNVALNGNTYAWIDASDVEKI